MFLQILTFSQHQTGYSTYAYTFSAAGTYEIGFGVANRTDNAATFWFVN
jgi:hypothetical protein